MSPTQSIDDSVVVSASAIDIGYGEARENLEDYCEATVVRMADGSLLHAGMVADGMGGIEGGEIASKTAVMTAINYLRNGTLAELPAVLEFALQAAQTYVVAKRRQLGYDRMGTTATLATITQDNRLYLAHVGDSRAYLVRDGQIHQLTRDHTWGSQMVREGKMSEAEAALHERSGALVQYLGRPHGITVDLSLRLNPEESDEQARANQGLSLLPGDSIILCSDGLIKARPRSEEHFVEPIEIAAMAGKYPPNEAAKRLVDLALKRRADDNISVVIMGIPRDAQISTEPAAAGDGEEGHTIYRKPAAEITDTTVPGRPTIRRQLREQQPRRKPERQSAPKQKRSFALPIIGAAIGVLAVVAVIIALVSLPGSPPPPEVYASITIEDISGHAQVKESGQDVDVTPGSPIEVRDLAFIETQVDGIVHIRLNNEDIELVLGPGSAISITPVDRGEGEVPGLDASLVSGRALVYITSSSAVPFTLSAYGLEASLTQDNAPVLPWTMGVESPGGGQFTVDCLQGSCLMIDGTVPYALESCTRREITDIRTAEQIRAVNGREWLALTENIPEALFCLETDTQSAASIEGFTLTSGVMYDTTLEDVFSFTWETTGAIRGEINNPSLNISQALNAEELAAGTLTITVHQPTRGEHTFTLVVYDSEGIATPARQVIASVQPVMCSAADGSTVYTAIPPADADLTEEPDEELLAEPPLENLQVRALGRSADLGWVLVAYNDLPEATFTGWVNADTLSCPVRLDRLVEAQP